MNNLITYIKSIICEIKIELKARKRIESILKTIKFNNTVSLCPNCKLPMIDRMTGEEKSTCQYNCKELTAILSHKKKEKTNE